MRNRTNKTQALLARKETLLKELQYYKKRIDEARNTKINTSYYEHNSSDSEQEFSIHISPSITELKLRQSLLKTCLSATQELTSVLILQLEVNIMVDNPVLDGEPQVTEDGVWREVIVECRIDQVPFSMSFYMHKPNRPFGPVSYRSLQVAAVKAAHDLELAKSVLSTVTTPSDAVEVIREYARAHRSRRASLARLAEAYAHALHMEPVAEGGYLLKCANILEVSWTLQNKRSPLAPFQHRMKFDVEYMDEQYVQKITQAHSQLSNPEIDTDERTMILAKIIKTCLEAEKPTQELHESFDSESLKEKRQTFDQEPEESEVPNKKSKDSEIMAPPKYPPKKIKPKGKENTAHPKDKKRFSENETNVKRPRIEQNKDVKNDNAKITTKNKLSNKDHTKKLGDTKSKKSSVQVNKCKEVKNDDNMSKASSSNNKNEVNNQVVTNPKTSAANDLGKEMNTKKDGKTVNTEPKKTTVTSLSKAISSSSKNDYKNVNLEKNSNKAKKNATLKNSEISNKRDEILKKKPINKSNTNQISIINGQKKKSIGAINTVSKKIKTSKIPRKRLSSESIKKNMLRISPRKAQSSFNSVQDSSKTSITSIQKPTHIPKLLKKPTTQPKTK